MSLAPETSLEDLLDDEDHACEMEHPQQVVCGKPATHLLRGGPCPCNPHDAWVCDYHLPFAVVISWWCDSCNSPYYWREQ